MSGDLMKCPRCKGRGKERMWPGAWWLAPLTLGLSIAVASEERGRCTSCRGKGYIRV